MKFIKGTLAALATATALGGQPAAADGLNLNLHIDLNGGNVQLRGGSIHFGTGRGHGNLRGNFDVSRFGNFGGMSRLERSNACHRAVEEAYKHHQIDRGERREGIAQCRNLVLQPNRYSR